MSQNDAKFEDGNERPIALKAIDKEDLKIISMLAQDSVFPITEIIWNKAEKQFALLLNRFRWEDKQNAAMQERNFERVQSVLLFDYVQNVISNGINQSDKDQILSVLSITFTPNETPSGTIILLLAGEGEIALEVECLEATLKDVTRPYEAVSKKSPNHNLT